jgi:hypothetical protein
MYRVDSMASEEADEEISHVEPRLVFEGGFPSIIIVFYFFSVT